MKSARFVLACAGVGGMLATTAVPGATIVFDNGASTGTWEDANNWNNPDGPNGIPGDADDNADGLPGAADQAVISSNFTASVSSPRIVSEVGVQWPGTAGQTNGSSTLNILPGAALSVTGGSGFRIGRTAVSLTAAGQASGTVVQSGGSLTITGSNGLRLAQDADSAVMPNAFYTISGGSLSTTALNLGRTGGIYDRAQFTVSGSGATSINASTDIVMNNQPDGTDVGLRETVLRFELDGGGVTPLSAVDEFRITNATGNAILELDLIGAPAVDQDVILIQAGRLTNGSPFTTFDDMPEGTLFVDQFGDHEYTYAIRYEENAADINGFDSRVYLDFVSRTVVPEPAGLALLGLGGLAVLRRRRRA